MLRLLKFLWIAWVTVICGLFTWAFVSPHVPKARLTPITQVLDVPSDWKKVKDLALFYGKRSERAQIIKSWKTKAGLYLVVCYDEDYRATQVAEAKGKELLIVTYWEDSKKCMLTHMFNGEKREVSISLEEATKLVRQFLIDLRPLLRGEAEVEI